VTDSLVLSDPGVVWTLTLNRQESRNAMSGSMVAELTERFAAAASDPECRAVVLAGAGADFCSGADVGELLRVRDGTGTIEFGQTFETLLRAMEAHPRPVIGGARGAALGAGCQLLLACDLAVVAKDAKIGIPSARLGLVIPFENVQRLVIGVGPKRAAEMLEAGRVLSGTEAVEWGLANRAVPTGEVVAAAAEMAERVAGLAPLSVRASKRGIREVIHGLSQDGRARSRGERDFDVLAAEALGSGDLREGLTAFIERRKPQFRGR